MIEHSLKEGRCRSRLFPVSTSPPDKSSRYARIITSCFGEFPNSSPERDLLCIFAPVLSVVWAAVRAVDGPASEEDPATEEELEEDPDPDDGPAATPLVMVVLLAGILYQVFTEFD